MKTHAPKEPSSPNQGVIQRPSLSKPTRVTAASPSSVPEQIGASDGPRGTASLPSITPAPGRPGHPTEDEIGAWWQRRLGKRAVLGQMGNRTQPARHLRLPILVWTKPAVNSPDPSGALGRDSSSLAEGRGAKGPSTRGNELNAGQAGSQPLNVIGRFSHWAGRVTRDTVMFLAVGLLRAVSAVVTAGMTIIDSRRNPFRFAQRQRRRNLARELEVAKQT